MVGVLLQSVRVAEDMFRAQPLQVQEARVDKDGSMAGGAVDG